MAEAHEHAADRRTSTWFEDGRWGSCIRCEIAIGPDDGHLVDNEPVCDECMQIEDWEIVNPALADELRARSAHG